MDSPALIFQALPKWDSPYASTALTIAKGLSQQHRVFYIEHPFTTKDAKKIELEERISLRKEHLIQQPFKDDFPDFYVVHLSPIFPYNWAPKNSFIFNTLKNNVVRKLRSTIDSLLSSRGISEWIYINSFDPVLWISNFSISPQKTIYHCVDWIKGEAYIAKHGAKAEQEVAQKADLVLTTSDPLAQFLSNLNPNTKCIPNAADFELFSSFSKEAIDLKSIPKPRVIYTGNIGLRLQYDLLETAARKSPDIQWIFVGPIDKTYFKGEGLQNLPNVHFLGSRKLDQLPSYLHYCDVGIIPFEQTELTKYIYPLKINEYLGAGLPVVASPFTDFSTLTDVVSLYTSADSLVKVIREEIKNNDLHRMKKRQSFAAQNTWSHRIREWERHLKGASHHA